MTVAILTYPFAVFVVRVAIFLITLICTFCITIIIFDTLAKSTHPFKQRVNYLETPKFIFLTSYEPKLDHEQMLILNKIIETFPDHLVELFLFDNGTIHSREKPLIRTLLDVLSTESLKEDTAENILIYLQIKNDNFHVHKVTFDQFFRYTQLETNWTRFTVPQLMLAARVLLIWQQSGLSFDLQNVGRHSLRDIFKFAEQIRNNNRNEKMTYHLTVSNLRTTTMPSTQQFDDKFLFLASKFQCNLYFENLLDKIQNYK